MATNKRDLKAYVRFDGTGRIIPGSLVLRRSKPKVGNWKEIQTYECCDGGGSSCTITRNIEEFTYPATTGILFQLVGGGCDGGMGEFNYLNIFIDSIPEVNNINDLVQILNENLSFYGTFSVTGPTEVSLKLSSYFGFVCSCGFSDILISNN